MISQANWIGVAGELIKEWTRRHLAWTAHYDVYPWCIDQVLIVVVVGGGHGEAISRANKQTAWVTPLRQATVSRQSRSLQKRRTRPHPSPTWQALSPDSATAFMAKVLHRKSSSTWHWYGAVTNTHTRVSSAQSSVEQAPQAGMPFLSAGGLLQLQAHSLQKLLIRRSSHVIQILTYSDFASLPSPPPVSCPSLRASLHRLRPVLVVEISDPIHIRKLKANVKTHKVANWRGAGDGGGNMPSRGSHNQLRNCRKIKIKEKP